MNFLLSLLAKPKLLKFAVEGFIVVGFLFTVGLQHMIIKQTRAELGKCMAESSVMAQSVKNQNDKIAALNAQISNMNARARKAERNIGTREASTEEELKAIGNIQRTKLPETASAQEREMQSCRDGLAILLR